MKTNNNNKQQRIKEMKKLIDSIYDYLPKVKEQPKLLYQTIEAIETFYHDFSTLFLADKDIKNTIDLINYIRELLICFIFNN